MKTLLVFLATLVPAAARAQQPPPNCSAAEHRQFDFWIGTWDVFNPSGALVGMNTITRDLNGCVLHESWQSLTSNHRGNSYNMYDRRTGNWHQSWVDNSGLLLQIDGGLVDGRMVMRGSTRGQNGAEVLQRITWSDEGEGRVRQLWEQSSDDGTTWTVAFDGMYRRR